MSLVHLLISLYIFVIFLAILMSWLPIGSSQSGLTTIHHVLTRLTEPVLRPLRAILPRPRLGGMMIDLSPLVAIVLLEILNNVI